MGWDDEDGHTIDGCTATAETDLAVLVEGKNIPGGKEWIPKSQLHDDSEVYEKGHEGTLVVKPWFARKQGWTT